MQILAPSLLVSIEKRMFQRNPALIAEPGDSNVRELIQSEERSFRVFEVAWLFQALDSSFGTAYDLRALAFKCSIATKISSKVWCEQSMLGYELVIKFFA